MKDDFNIISEVMQNAGKAIKASEIAERSGIERKQVDKILKEMNRENLIISPQRCYWQLKK